jgi:RNA polymerase-binding protein DksA
MPQAQMLSSLRQALEAERDQLQRQVDEHSGVDYDENFADSGQVAAEQGENRTMANQMGDALSEVELALARLDDGTYGTCEVCGNEISEARLEAMPATRYCIEHANSRS